MSSIDLIFACFSLSVFAINFHNSSNLRDGEEHFRNEIAKGKLVQFHRLDRTVNSCDSHLV